MTVKDTKTTKKKSENGKVGFHRWLPKEMDLIYHSYQKELIERFRMEIDQNIARSCFIIVLRQFGKILFTE